MIRRISMVLGGTGLVLALVWGAFAQQGSEPTKQAAAKEKGKGKGPQRPGLFFREDWKQTPAGGEHVANPAESVSSPNLELTFYGPSSKEMLLTGAANDDNNPIHLWTGLCTSPCAAALRDKSNYVDLTGLARMHWVTKTSGFHQVRPMLKLADGTWVVGDRVTTSTSDWLEDDFNISQVHWLKLDPERVVSVGNVIDKVDLSKIDAVGFADLMPSSGHGPGGWVDVARFEVYGKPVKREQ